MPLELQAKHGEPEAVKVGGAAQQQVSARPLVVLVLSSMPRGGSTLLTELLSAVHDSVVLFEPLWYIEKQDCFMEEACVLEYLGDVLACSFKLDFEYWLKKKDLFFHYFSPEARRCQDTKSAEAKAACLKGMNLRQECGAAPLVIVKVIRARLSLVKYLLQDPRINLKVIHLTRDPRASIRSIASFGWNANPHTRCSEMYDDLQTYEKLRQASPAEVTQVRYEQLCLRPREITSDIFRFLFDNATLPGPVSAFVDKHMLGVGKNGGTMNTVKNSSAEFESWRYKIDAKRLKDIEEEPVCEQAIRHMGHALFGTLKAANNSKIPLILNT